VQADMRGGNALGVTGTPAFFVNGRFLSGAQPFDAFKQIIDDELERAGG
jgi:protein-disulfide isomerase